MKRLIHGLLAVALAAIPALARDPELGLPTPLSFYSTYNTDVEGGRLMQDFLDSLDPQTRAIVSKLLLESGSKGPPDLPKEQVKAFAQSLNWRAKKRALLDQVLFRSQVLDLIPAESAGLWRPIVYDALIYFLGNLSDERMFDLAWNFAHMPQDVVRGQKILTLVNRIPTLQKLAQILARNPAIPADIRESLQTLESNVHTTSAQEVIGYIKASVPPEVLDQFQVRFDDKILGEASVGAVIRATAMPPGETKPIDVVIKVIKPYARQALPEEMQILDRMTQYFETQTAFYHIADAPVTGMFRDLRAGWEKEIRVEEERANFREAAVYYERNPHVKIPRLFDLHSPTVTMMEFIHGTKITSAFPGDPTRRAVLARRLYDVLTFDPLYSGREVALFHGDPHAGNVFHVEDNPKDPYQLALLDWGLCGHFGKAQRRHLVQMFLGLEYKDPSRMMRGVNGLIEGGVPRDPARRKRLREIFAEVFAMKNVKSDYERLSELVRLVAFEGYKVEQQFALFIKAQLTIVGILAELDPNFDQMRYAKSKVRKQVARELPLRILLAPAWNYHGYPSMMSNEDVRDGIGK